MAFDFWIARTHWYHQLCVTRLFSILILCVQLTTHAMAYDVGSAEAILAEAIETNRPLTRAETLSLLVGEKSFGPALLLKALASSDVNTRKVAALQIGELRPEALNPEIIALLVSTTRDTDPGIAKQAMASIIRIGRSAPDNLLSLIRNTVPLRDLDITPSDLAITGLYYGGEVKLDELVSAYVDAMRNEAKTKKNLKRPHDRESVEPGSSDYFARALSALLPRSPVVNHDLILRLLHSADPRLRQVAYDAAGAVKIDDEKLILQLASVVRDGPDDIDRSRAARALASQGPAGRAALFNLVNLKNPAARGAVIGALLKGADCSSPLLAFALADAHDDVRQAGLSAMLDSRSDGTFRCLATFVTDHRIKWELRSKLLYRIFSEQNLSNRTDRSTDDFDNLFQILRPVLSNRHSDLYVDAWYMLETIVTERRALPDLAYLQSAILDRMFTLKALSDEKLELIEVSVPSDLFAQQWRRLAASKTGTSRLAIYRIAASRGLAVDEAIALFVDVLSGKTDGLGADDARRFGYGYMGGAIRGLLAAGERGRAVIRGFLRGENGVWVPSSDALSVLAEAMNGDELRPFFTSSDKTVLQTLLRVKSPDFWKGLSKEDGETLVANFLKRSDPYLRGQTATLLVKLKSCVPLEFTTETLERLLLDDAEWPRDAALKVLGQLRPGSVSALDHVLSGPQADRVARPGLAAAVQSLGSEGKPLLPKLVALQKRFPRSRPLIEALGKLANDDPGVISILEQQLISDDEGVRTSALKALSARGFSSSSSATYLAALIEEKTVAQVDAYLDEVLAQIRPRPVPTSGRAEAFPEFPWPPPPWSFKEIVPKELVGADRSDLGQVLERLTTAIRAANRDYDYGLFGVPGGFVLLARLERIQPDGTPFAGRDRWNANPIPAKSLEDWLVGLFFSPPGYYRVVAFAVTNEEPIETAPGSELPRVAEGAKTLPDNVAKLPFADRNVYALIYTFQRYDGAKMVLNYEGSPSGRGHLDASGIWHALEKRPSSN
jgi:hypothetical protein